MANLERKKHGEVLTPDWLIDKMLKQAGDLTGKKVADLGANRGQFLKRAMLMYPGIDPMDWILLEVQERYHRYHRRYTGWNVQHELKEPVDILLGNPPYNGGLDLRLVLRYLPLVKERVLVVHPSTWLIDVKTQLGPKTGSPLFRKFQDMVGPYLKSVSMFNGNRVFGIGLFVPCVITDMDMRKPRPQGTHIKVKDVGQEESRDVFGLEDITLHGVAWRSCVKEFMGRVQKFCAKNGSLGSKYVTGARSTAPCPVQVASIKGNWGVGPLRQHKDDFFAIIRPDVDACRGVVSANPRQLIWELGTKKEQDSFLGYLQTDFARLCVSLLKTNQNLDQGQLTVVPWLDFTRSWNDDQLFAMLGYPRGHAIREYAKQFLPDYHSVYPNGKTY